MTIFIELLSTAKKALKASFSIGKILSTLPFLLGCGYILFFSKSYLADVHPWILFGLTFVPLVAIGFIFLIIGIYLIHSYYQEQRLSSVKERSDWRHSLKILGRASYLGIPMAMIFILKKVLLVSCFGLIYLFQEIPVLGVVAYWLTIGMPWLVLCGASALGLLCFFALFFVTPLLVMNANESPLVLVQQVCRDFRAKKKVYLALFAFGFFPLFLVGSLIGLLIWISFGWQSSSIGFFSFTLLPCCLLLAPALIFFFNTAAIHCLFLNHREGVIEN